MYSVHCAHIRRSVQTCMLIAVLLVCAYDGDDDDEFLHTS